MNGIYVSCIICYNFIIYLFKKIIDTDKIFRLLAYSPDVLNDWVSSGLRLGAWDPILDSRVGG